MGVKRTRKSGVLPCLALGTLLAHAGAQAQDCQQARLSALIKYDTALEDFGNIHLTWPSVANHAPLSKLAKEFYQAIHKDPLPPSKFKQMGLHVSPTLSGQLWVCTPTLIGKNGFIMRMCDVVGNDVAGNRAKADFTNSYIRKISYIYTPGAPFQYSKVFQGVNLALSSDEYVTAGPGPMHGPL